MAKAKKPPVEAEKTAEANNSGYTVLARRYRPQAFSQLIGQGHVAQALENAIKSNRVAHAYLFTGARGVGKTSTARILAKCLNCEKGPTVTPCDECTICKSITGGEDIDVLEIDGASNNKVDEVRELRSNVQFRPARARYKIYIIDEVHMLSTSAFNALLKTLEEPPPHVKFIFATTEANKIPITILSRCQRFDFAGIGTTQIIDRLRDIVQREGKEAEEEALAIVARRAGGSMRDAQSLLDQLLAFGGDKLTADEVHGLLGTAGDDRVAELATAVLDRDASRAIALLAELSERTLQPGELIDQLAQYWRDLMVANIAGKEAPDLSVPARQREALLAQAKSLSLDSILAGLEVLNSARFRLRSTSHGRLIVEMALVRLARLPDLTPIDQLTQMLNKEAGAAGSRSATRPAATPGVVEGLKKKLAEAAQGEATALLPVNDANLPTILSRMSEEMPQFLGVNVKKAVQLAISGPNALVLRFPPAYNGERDYVSQPDKLAKVEAWLAGISGQTWKIRTESTGELTKEQVAETLAQQRPVEVESALVKQRRAREEAEQHPLIKRAKDVLAAQVVRVDEGFSLQPAGAVAAPVAVVDSENDNDLPAEKEEM